MLLISLRMVIIQIQLFTQTIEKETIDDEILEILNIFFVQLHRYLCLPIYLHSNLNRQQYYLPQL